MTHEEFLKLIREKCTQIAKNSKNIGMDVMVKEYYLEKFCETCKKFNDDENMLICDICEDTYHTYCLSPPLKEIPGED